MSDSTSSLPSLSSFDRHLLAERLRIRRHDQTLLSAAHVRAKVEPHQWAAVQQALQGIPPRVLLADDGDLGRRTQAMALLKELALRGQADRVLVIPAGGYNEEARWVRTMHHDFGLDMEGADHSWIEEQRLRQDPDTNLWSRPRQRVVVPKSVLRYGKQGRNLACQPWDVVIVEDALKLFQGRTVADSQAARAAEAVQQATARIFCCEQPHREGLEAFWDLIELLDPLSVLAHRKSGSRGVLHRIVRRSPATVAGVESAQPAMVRHAVELSEAEQAFHRAATTYISDVYPVLEKDIDYTARTFTEGMTGALLEHPMAFVKALQERVDVIRVGRGVAFSEEAEALLAGDRRSEDLSEEKRTQAQDELRAVADAHSDVMLDDELNRIVALVEQAQALNPHAKTRVTRNVIDEIREETPDASIIVLARQPSTMRAMQAASADASWHERVVVHDTFYDEEARAKVQAALNAREAAVLVTSWGGAMGLDHIQAETTHVINFDLAWHPPHTQHRMCTMQQMMSRSELTWHNLHLPGTREGQLVATMYEHVHPLYEVATADSTVDGVFDSLDAKRTVMDAVRNDLPADQVLQGLQADLDACIEQLQMWQESDFLTCTSFDARDTRQVESMVAAAERMYGAFDERAALVAACIGRNGGTWTSHGDGTYAISLYAEGEATRYAFDPDTARTEEVEYLGPGHPLMETAAERVLKSEMLSSPVGQKQAAFLSTPGITFVYRLVFEDGNGHIVHETLYPLHVPADGRAPGSTRGERVLQAGTEASSDHPAVGPLRAQRTVLQARAEAALHEQVPMIEEQLASARRTRADQEEERLKGCVQHHGPPMTEAEDVQMGHRHVAIDTHRTLDARPPVLVGWCYAIPA
ncbi:MAG: hypothetical protein R6U20_08430 [Longimonas sp.]|uniref:hypothetical protein n=1 Tax=Longimonas sp. TaxID=2039626 RepID=UPI0039764DC8